MYLGRRANEGIGREGQLSAYRHPDFGLQWILRDKNMLHDLWCNNQAVEKMVSPDFNFWNNKNVLITGHTGFKAVGSPSSQSTWCKYLWP